MVEEICTDADPGFVWCDPPVSHIRWDFRPLVRRIARWTNNVANGSFKEIVGVHVGHVECRTHIRDLDLSAIVGNQNLLRHDRNARVAGCMSDQERVGLCQKLLAVLLVEIAGHHPPADLGERLVSIGVRW
jgi:hypothetical protein